MHRGRPCKMSRSKFCGIPLNAFPARNRCEPWEVFGTLSGCAKPIKPLKTELRGVASGFPRLKRVLALLRPLQPRVGGAAGRLFPPLDSLGKELLTWHYGGKASRYGEAGSVFVPRQASPPFRAASGASRGFREARRPSSCAALITGRPRPRDFPASLPEAAEEEVG